jgi:hypothetical protein
VSRHGIPLREYLLPKKVDVGLTFEASFGMVPELEEREAAVFVHCPWSTWLDLHPFERAAHVAHYRLHLLIDAHVQDAAEAAAKRNRED